MIRLAGRICAAVLVVATFFAGGVSAQEETLLRVPSDSLAAAMARSEQRPRADSSRSLAGYLELAAQHNPALRSAYYKWMAALERSGYAGALPDPVLAFGYFAESVETRVGPQNLRAGLRQSFPWFGTLGAKEDMASEEANAAYQQFEAERLRLLYRVKAAYYDYYFLLRDIAITRENLDLLTYWESVARSNYRTALGRHPDVIRAQVELGKLEDRLLTLRDRIEAASARLAAATNAPVSAPIAFPDSLAVPEPDLSDSLVVNAMREYNPDLRSIRHIIEKEKAGVSYASKSVLPAFTLGVDYIETGPALNPATFESGKDAWIVGVTVSLPIWFGKNSARKQEAVARRMQAEYSLVEAENRLEAYVENLLFEHDDALRKLRLYRDGLLPKAQQSLNASYTAYQAGELDFLNVLDAQRQLLEFQRFYERAVADLGIRQAELEMVTGKRTGELIIKGDL